MAEAGIEVRPSLEEADATTGWSCRCRSRFPLWRPAPIRRRSQSGLRKELQAAADQAHSYALWTMPAYYVITDGRIVSVWDFQGAIAPGRKVLRVSQSELAGSFYVLSTGLNPRAAAAARQAKFSRLADPR